MIEQDTIRLLRECDAGIKMGISSIDDVTQHIRSDRMREILIKSREKHEQLKEEAQRELARFQDEGKDPSMFVEAMAQLKTNFKLAVKDSDETIAGLMVDGCDMGVKSLSKYLNEYAAADEKSKDITKKLISIEEDLGKDLREYL